MNSLSAKIQRKMGNSCPGRGEMNTIMYNTEYPHSVFVLCIIPINLEQYFKTQGQRKTNGGHRTELLECMIPYV